MEHTGRKPKEKPKRGEGRAQIEFAAPYSLADCLYRLRDTKYLDTGFMSPGIDPSFEKEDAITYQFCIRRTWYDYRYRQHGSYVEIRGYLRALDEGTTIVIGKIHTSPLAYVLAGVIFLMAATVIIPPAATGVIPFLAILPFMALTAIFPALIYFDRRTLLRLIHTTLGGEV
jgi:hypothetical protein